MARTHKTFQTRFIYVTSSQVELNLAADLVKIVLQSRKIESNPFHSIRTQFHPFSINLKQLYTPLIPKSR